MSVIVTDAGFAPPAAREIVALADLRPQDSALDLAQTDDPQALEGRLGQLVLIRVAFPAFSDGRAAACSRRHSSTGTSTAASAPRRVTNCGPSARQASRNSLKRAFASCTGQACMWRPKMTSQQTSLASRCRAHNPGITTRTPAAAPAPPASAAGSGAGRPA